MFIEPKDFMPIASEFRNVFGLDLGKHIVFKMMLAEKVLMFNMIKFCDWLEERYPEDCKVEGASYSDVVRKRFGERGENLIKKIIE